MQVIIKANTLAYRIHIKHTNYDNYIIITPYEKVLIDLTVILSDSCDLTHSPTMKAVRPQLSLLMSVRSHLSFLMSVNKNSLSTPMKHKK